MGNGISTRLPDNAMKVGNQINNLANTIRRNIAPVATEEEIERDRIENEHSYR
ncbi:MAG: hypothetical protein LW832_07270 [Parachlamydia sp.]|nr:hypothetical protein [Parachlamydia sp.]